MAPPPSPTVPSAVPQDRSMALALNVPGAEGRNTSRDRMETSRWHAVLTRVSAVRCAGSGKTAPCPHTPSEQYITPGTATRQPGSTPTSPHGPGGRRLPFPGVLSQRLSGAPSPSATRPSCRVRSQRNSDMKTRPLFRTCSQLPWSVVEKWKPHSS